MAYAAMFETWSVEEDDMEFEVLLDLGRGEEYPVAELPWFFGVRVPMAKPDEDGTPGEEERRRLDQVENRIRALLRDRGAVYVGRRTGARNRDLMFYAEARPRGVEDRIRSSVGMEILFMSQADPDWRGYESMLPEPRHLRQVEDRRILQGLINLDADPEKVHQVEHRVTTSSQKGAEALARFYEKLELKDVEISGKRPEIIVTGVQETTLDLKAIHRVAWYLESKSPKAKGEYEGWSAAPELLDEPDDFGLDDDVGDAGLEALLAALGGGDE